MNVRYLGLAFLVSVMTMPMENSSRKKDVKLDMSNFKINDLPLRSDSLLLCVFYKKMKDDTIVSLIEKREGGQGMSANFGIFNKSEVTFEKANKSKDIGLSLGVYAQDFDLEYAPITFIKNGTRYFGYLLVERENCFSEATSKDELNIIKKLQNKRLLRCTIGGKTIGKAIKAFEHNN